MNPTHRGIAAALFAYGSWGFFPLYFKQISAADPVDVIAWRVLFCFISLIALFLLWKGPVKFINLVKAIDQWWLLLASAFLLSANWLVFVYAIKNDQILQSSMGYFLVPIMSVGLGALVFQERPNKIKWAAVIVASIGMLITFVVAGVLPWISLALGGTFGLYGMLRKMARYDSAIGLFMETSVLIPVAVIYLLVWAEPLSSFDGTTQFWMYSLGIVTAAPLLTMIFAARRIQLGTLGFFQYITPCLHLFWAVVVYNEEIDLSRLIALLTTLLAVAIWLVGSSPKYAKTHTSVNRVG